MDKPSRVFDRTREWQGLASFAHGPPQKTHGPPQKRGSGATLGVVSGRRRQGKSFLLQALCEASGGMYFAATEATEAESLRLFTEALTRFTREFVDLPFRDWNDAVNTV